MFRQPRCAAIILCLLPTVLLLAAASPAPAAILNVTSTADLPDDNWSDGICRTAPGGPCTLRGAVDEAWGNGNAEPDVINLPAGDFALSRGELLISNSGTVKIAGVGAGKTTIRQTGAERVIHSTAPGGPLLLRDLTVRGGRLRSGSALPQGAGIRAAVGLDLDGVVVYDNRVVEDAGGPNGRGGGIYAGIDVKVVRSRIVRNEAPEAGGLEVQADQIEIADSAIERNTAWAANGGGMTVFLNPGVTSTGRIVDSTIAHNSAPAGLGGGLVGGGGLNPFILEGTLVHGNTAFGSAGWVLGGTHRGRATSSSFSANRATLGGLTAGAIDRQFGSAPPLRLHHVTLSGNSTADGPVALRSGGSGLIELKGTIVDGECNSASGFVVDAASLSSSASCGMPATPDLGLQGLADNGGPTMTHALTAGSPAIGASSECPLIDQRGAARLGPPCDSGAYEFGAAPPPPPAPPPPAPDVDGDGVEDLDDACVELAGDRADGCPPPPPSTPKSAAEGGNPGAAPLVSPRELAAFNVNQAQLRQGRLIVAARISPGAGGRCEVVLRSGGRALRFEVPVRLERISFRRKLPQSLRDAGSLNLTLRYPGTDTIAPARVNLLAGPRLPRLTLHKARLSGGRLLAVGRVSRRAAGWVNLVVLPTSVGSGEALEAKARIEGGRWRLSRRLAGLTAEHRRILVSYRGLKARGIGGAQFSQRLRGAGSR